jgi:putative glutamine amidotransferase
LRQIDPDRWDYEVELTRLAWEQKVPVLGICRGCQTMAEALDGGQVSIIIENTMVGGKHYQRGRAAETSHAIETAANSRLRTILGQVAKVNSFHRQFVSQPPTGFSATAFSDDGYIEAIEAENGFIIGVQFHPEWLRIVLILY